ncbi:MAG: DUF302 domain-containing protein [Nanoarchaeota archaeon]
MVLKKMISRLMMGKIVYKVESNKNFERTIEDLKTAITNNGFKVTKIHDLKETFQKNNLKTSNDFKYQLVQFCNPQKAHNVLSMSTDAGIMMPKTIIAFQKDGQSYLQFMKMKPFMVKLMFPDINLAPMSRKVMGTMTKIAHEAAA